MTRTFFVVGPTATGKSEFAADLAKACGAEVVSADAFQIYRGLDLLSAKPNATTVAKARHHLVGTVPLQEEMNAEKFRRLALAAISEVNSRGNDAIVVGGSGLYVRAITHGFTSGSGADPRRREELNLLSLEDLHARLRFADPETAASIDPKNKRRLVRAVEIADAGTRVGDHDGQRTGQVAASGVVLFRDRQDLYERINRRVEMVFENGVVEEVRGTGETSDTAGKMIGLQEIRDLIAGKINREQCVAAIQQRTRRYAKRQLTWFRHQTNFEPLNLSLSKEHSEALDWIKARFSSAPADD